MKRITSLLLTAVMLATMLTVFALPAFAANCGDGVNWGFSEGTLTISGSGNMNDYTSKRNTPWWSDRDSIKRIVINDGVKHIGEYAFCDMDKVESIKLGKDVESIGKYAFAYMDGLQGKIELPAATKKLGEGAFTESTLVELVINGNITTWGESVFEECDELEAVYFKEGATLIGDSAFYGCSDLAAVHLPKTLKTIEEDAFYSWSDHLKYIYFSGNNFLNDVSIDDSNNDIFDDYVTIDNGGVTCINRKGEKEKFPIGNNLHFLTSKTTVLENGWYVCAGEYDFEDVRLKVKGNVGLILLDECGITTEGGIGVDNGGTFGIYSTSLGNEMGYIEVEKAPQFCAGIGGNGYGSAVGTSNPKSLIFCGGKIEVVGGDYQGVGIGTGSSTNNGNTSIEIFNGNITATGHDGAGIGSDTSTYAKVIIHGGTVTAWPGSEQSDAIGQSNYSYADVYVSNTAKVTVYDYSNSKYTLTQLEDTCEYTQAMRNEALSKKDYNVIGIGDSNIGSLISQGDIWIIAGVAVAAAAVIVVLVIKNKKKAE